MACVGCTTEERHARHMQAFRGLARAHAVGALGAVARRTLDVGGLGSLEPGAWSYEPAAIDVETEDFNSRLNAWMLDYASAAGRLPASLIQQVDDFVGRWRALRESYYFFTGARGKAILEMEAEWNRYRDQVASYGATSAITPATVTVDGKQVRADEIPAGSSTIDRIETIAKWAGVIVAGAAVLKISSDLGLFKKLGGLWGGRVSNPRRRWPGKPSPQPEDLCAARIGDRYVLCGQPRMSASHRRPCRAGKDCACKGTNDHYLCHPFVEKKKRNPARPRRAA